MPISNQDIMNYDEIERKWNLKHYEKASNSIPQGCSTIAAMLSACVYQVCQDLTLEKQEQINTIDEELDQIFSSGLNSTSSSSFESASEKVSTRKNCLSTRFEKADINDFTKVKIIDESDPASAF